MLSTVRVFNASFFCEKKKRITRRGPIAQLNHVCVFSRCLYFAFSKIRAFIYTWRSTNRSQLGVILFDLVTVIFGIIAN